MQMELLITEKQVLIAITMELQMPVTPQTLQVKTPMVMESKTVQILMMTMTES